MNYGKKQRLFFITLRKIIPLDIRLKKLIPSGNLYKIDEANDAQFAYYFSLTWKTQTAKLTKFTGNACQDYPRISSDESINYRSFHRPEQRIRDINDF